MDASVDRTGTAARSDERRSTGILLMMATVACFAACDALTKLMLARMEALQIISVRYVVGFLFMTAVISPWKRPGSLRTRMPALQLLRGLLAIAATCCSFFALRYLPLDQFTAIAFAAPLIVALLAGPLLGEWIGRRRLVAVLAGFCGILIVTRPGLGMQLAMLLPLGTACFNALFVIATRFIAGHDPPETTLFYSGLAGAVMFLPVVPLVWATPPDLWHWAGLAAISVLAAFGQWLLILAYRHAPAPVLAPFSYVQLIFAVGLGAVLFGQWPDAWTFGGGGLVAASGLYLLQRERYRKVPPSAEGPV